MYARNKYKRWSLIIFTICFCIYIATHVLQYRMAILDGWNVNTSRDITIYISPNISTTVTKPESLCKSKGFLLVIVCSSPMNFEQRVGIRESWGLDRNISNSIISIYFLLGLTINSTVQELIDTENDIYRDIIQENFIDTYNNLTIKSVMLLKLIKDECSESVKFIMKTDDDTFVNLPNLISTLRNTNTPILFGKLIRHSKPIRNYYDKWYVPHYMYPDVVYPNYLSGTAYVMTPDISMKLFETALRVPLLHLEDVYLTGICAKIANIKPKMNINFNTLPVKFDRCKFQTLITSHYISPLEMRFLYHRVKNENSGKVCNQQRLKGNNTKFSLKPRRIPQNATTFY
ncbi:hypothetical protein RN001_002012 [Aquatica leii]|uniref:Hexosyltransferase n=1 Tax=Aquatica leii TaxID=1421715 RepID=A0AAN7PPB4_9COLE|nr:hypothetical protein RN001_002012 [Aquatica leii]